MSWTLSKDTMIIACSKGADNAASNIMLIRNQDNDMVDVTDFQNPVVKRLTTSRGCQNSMIHPEMVNYIIISLVQGLCSDMILPMGSKR